MWSSLHTVETTLKYGQHKRFKSYNECLLPNCDVRNAVEMRLGRNLSNCLFLAELLSFLGSGASPVAEEPGHEPSSRLALRQLGQLPRPQLVRVNEDCGEGHQEAVSHVEDADNLQENVSGDTQEERDTDL